MSLGRRSHVWCIFSPKNRQTRILYSQSGKERFWIHNPQWNRHVGASSIWSHEFPKDPPNAFIDLESESHQAALLYPSACEEKLQLTRENVSDFGRALYDLHTLEIVHHDLCLSNIGHYENDKIMVSLICDFGFAVKSQKAVQYSGTIETASTCILQLLLKNNTTIISSPCNDLELLWKSLLIIALNVHPRVPLHANLEEKVVEVMCFWDTLNIQDAQPILDKIESEAKLKKTYDFSDYLHFFPYGYSWKLPSNSKSASPVKPPNHASDSFSSFSSPHSLFESFAYVHDSRPISGIMNSPMKRKSVRIEKQREKGKEDASGKKGCKYKWLL